VVPARPEAEGPLLTMRNSKARARREAPEFHLPRRGTESGQLRARGRLPVFPWVGDRAVTAGR
jgi:hypothetical protein